MRTTSTDEEKERIQNSLEFKKGNGLELIWAKVSKEKGNRDWKKLLEKSVGREETLFS